MLSIRAHALLEEGVNRISPAQPCWKQIRCPARYITSREIMILDSRDDSMPGLR